MSEHLKQDNRELATMLEDLPKDERNVVKGLIIGLQLARKPTGPDGQPGRVQT